MISENKSGIKNLPKPSNGVGSRMNVMTSRCYAEPSKTAILFLNVEKLKSFKFGSNLLEFNSWNFETIKVNVDGVINRYNFATKFINKKNGKIFFINHDTKLSKKYIEEMFVRWIKIIIKGNNFLK